MVLAMSLFYHLHLFVAVFIMTIQFTVQLALAILEILFGIHSAALLNLHIFIRFLIFTQIPYVFIDENEGMIGGVLLQQCTTMRKTYHGIYLRLSTYSPKPSTIYVPKR